MKRMHIHVGVKNLAESIRFYNALFGVEPVKTKEDYAKWMLDDPRINFAISTRSKIGVDHLGLQVDDEQELSVLRQRLDQADLSVFNEGETVCCYAHSDKTWVADPSGIAWEAYQTMEDAQVFSDTTNSNNACCTPTSKDNAINNEATKTNSGCCG